MISNKLYFYDNLNYQLTPPLGESKLVFSFEGFELYKLSKKEEMQPFESLSLSKAQTIGFLRLFSKVFPYFNDQYDLEFIPKLLWPTGVSYYNEVTFFGGSFNPWHEGHGECLRQCPEDNIVVVPDYSPWKDNTVESPLKFIIQLRKLIGSSYPIYPGFLLSEKRNPTSTWLPEIRERAHWLMGDDTFYTFLKWKDPQKILAKIASFYVVPREHTIEQLKDVEKQIREINSKIEVHYLNEHEYMDVSSTKLRNN